MPEDRLGLGAGYALNGFELGERGGADALQASERGEQRLRGLRADAGDVEETRAQALAAVDARLEAHGDAVRFVARPSEEEERRALRAEEHRVLAARQVGAINELLAKHVLALLRERADVDALDRELAEDRRRHGK